MLKYFLATIFRGVKFSLSGQPRKFITGYGRAVASAFIVKFGRQLLQKYSCERATPLRTVRAVAVNGCIDIDGTVIVHFTEEGSTVLYSFAYFFIRFP